jgi:hypothetical protein
MTLVIADFDNDISCRMAGAAHGTQTSCIATQLPAYPRRRRRHMVGEFPADWNGGLRALGRLVGKCSRNSTTWRIAGESGR